MPELPEVETVKKILEPLIKNKKIEKVEVFYDRLVQSDLTNFKQELAGQTILSMNRYGKYLFFNLTNDLILISHLRMEGKFRYTTHDFRIKSTSAVFYFTDSSALSYDDTRKFGLMYLTNKNDIYKLPMLTKLGIEANNVLVSDLPILYKKFNRNKKIKELLLDQTILTGIGNIYADEILYASYINPFTMGSELNQLDINNIVSNAKIILNQAITKGGSTIHSFHPSEGVDGKFQVLLKCYGKEGKPCPRCGTLFHKDFIGGRGTTFCPNCQINKHLEKAIGITGPVGSGKTQILNHLKKKGYFTLSADEIIHTLYKDESIRVKISKILKTDFNVDDNKKRELARSILINNPTIKSEVENFIYPKLEQVLLSSLNSYEKVAYEVPLLFKAHFEYMFKKIFVIKLTKEKQLLNLIARGEKNKEKLLKLNNDFKYNSTSSKIVLIENNGDLEDLFKKIDSNLD